MWVEVLWTARSPMLLTLVSSGDFNFYQRLKIRVTLDAGTQYHTFNSRDEAAFMVLANPCTHLKLILTIPLLKWWNAAKQLVLAKYPIPQNCKSEVHLITEVIISPQWLRHYQASGIHQHGIITKAGATVQGMIVPGGSLYFLHGTSAVAGGSGNFVCFTKSISCKRSKFLGAGIPWAANIYQFDPRLQCTNLLFAKTPSS
jgi:hypothetical protein